MHLKSKFGFKVALCIVSSLGLGLAYSLRPSAIAQPNIEPIPIPVISEPIVFKDISPNYWAKSYIEALADLNIISGFPDGTFRPNAPVTRAQFAAMLRQAFLRSELPTIIPPEARPFTDVQENYWAAEAITQARSSGFLSGYPGNRFAPEQNIPRIQALVSLASGLNYTADASEMLLYYKDVSEIPNYAREKAAAASLNGLVVNHPVLNQLEPNRRATRAEVAAFVYRALVKKGQANASVRSPYEVLPASSWQQTPIAFIPSEARQIALSNYNDRARQRLATLSAAGDRVQIWNILTGEQVAEKVFGENVRAEAIALSADAQKVAAIVQTKPGYGLELWVWNVNSEASLVREPLGARQLLTSNSPVEPGFAPVRAKVAFRANSYAVLSYVKLGEDTAEGPGASQLQFHGEDISSIISTLTPTEGADIQDFSISPDGRLLAARSNVLPNTNRKGEPVVDLWQLDEGDRVFTLRGEDDQLRLAAMSFTPTGALRILENNDLYDTRLNTFNPKTRERISQVTALAGTDRQDGIHILSPDGVYYFMRGDVAGTRLLNTQTQAVTRLDSYVTDAVFSSDGVWLAINDRSSIRIFSRSQPAASP